jgi:hypothetical protein
MTQDTTGQATIPTRRRAEEVDGNMGAHGPQAAERGSPPESRSTGAGRRPAFLQGGDVAASVRELSRVLKDGAPFSVAAWDAMALNTPISHAVQVLRRHVPAGLLPDFDYLTELATPGLRERPLREAGVSTLRTTMFSWQLSTPSAAAVISASVAVGRAHDGLAGRELEIVKGELEQETAEFRTADGTCSFPVACRLFWGSKQGSTQ